MDTKKVKIKEKEYTIRRPDFGIDNAVLDAAGFIDMETGHLVMKAGTQRRTVIKLCVIDPVLSDKDIAALDPKAGTTLFMAIESFRKKIPLEESPNSSSDIKAEKSQNGK